MILFYVQYVHSPQSPVKIKPWNTKCRKYETESNRNGRQAVRKKWIPTLFITTPFTMPFHIFLPLEILLLYPYIISYVMFLFSPLWVHEQHLTMSSTFIFLSNICIPIVIPYMCKPPQQLVLSFAFTFIQYPFLITSFFNHQHILLIFLTIFNFFISLDILNLYAGYRQKLHSYI